MTSFNLGNPSGEIEARELTITTVISEAGHMTGRGVECKRSNKEKKIIIIWVLEKEEVI